MNFFEIISRFSREMWSMKSTTVQMIDLVLQARRKNAVRLDLLSLVIGVKVADANPRRALDFLVNLGDRQTALIIRGEFVGRPKHFRICRKPWGGRSPSSSCRLVTSRTRIRFISPIWVAARPMPGAAYTRLQHVVMSARISSSTAATG